MIRFHFTTQDVPGLVTPRNWGVELLPWISWCAHTVYSSPSVLAGADVCHLRAASLMLNSLIRCLWHPQTPSFPNRNSKTIECLCNTHTSISPWCFCAYTLTNSLLCLQTPDGCLQSQPLEEESYSNCLMDNKLYWLCCWCEWMFSSWGNKRSPGVSCRRYVSLYILKRGASWT